MSGHLVRVSSAEVLLFHAKTLTLYIDPLALKGLIRTFQRLIITETLLG